MNKFVAFFCLLAVSYTLAAPRTRAEISAQRALPALSHEEVHDQYGQFALRYVTAEGTIVYQRGSLIPDPSGSGYVMVFEGEITEIGSDGKVYITKYTAGPDGYKVEGDHLPKAPEAPPFE